MERVELQHDQGHKPHPQTISAGEGWITGFGWLAHVNITQREEWPGPVDGQFQSPFYGNRGQEHDGSCKPFVDVGSCNQNQDDYGQGSLSQEPYLLEKDRSGEFPEHLMQMGKEEFVQVLSGLGYMQKPAQEEHSAEDENYHVISSMALGQTG